MVLNGIGASQGQRPSGLSHSADAQTPAAETRALVPVPAAAPSESHTPYAGRPAAPFLAQLIATERGEPQTRERRRAKPEAAAQAYRAAARLRFGELMSRSS
jgi:hypothetical protein